ncbi:hypothetical protein F3Y22_tig00006365pilonHSYRG00038 [Hibiscus syriacus]|uniref:Integrase catalytic domain-containing protein n=1 Tax=Hibiscus syriacus TaxID=106335 RepID=A0A6A3CHG9_HIBSY|nr:hypothetical protein F3Y22_tig00006365pilonHSYRG00038 [Hibiscus syriacus]
MTAKPTNVTYTAIDGNNPYAFSVQWIINSGASDHMTGNIDLLEEYNESSLPASIKIADDSLTTVKGSGSVTLNKNLILHNVLYAQDSKRVIGSARLGKGLYTLGDDYSRTTWVFLMREKSEEKGIVHLTSCVNTPQQNGVAERKNRHLLEVTRSLLFAANAPKYLWGEALLTATYLINRMPSKTLDFKIPTKGESYKKFQSVQTNISLQPILSLPITVSPKPSSIVPVPSEEAFQSPEWKKAVEEEIKALQKNKTWSLTDFPEGKLIYLSLTRPDIAYSNSKVLEVFPGAGLIFRKNQDRTVKVYTDASWGGELTDRSLISTTSKSTMNFLTERNGKLKDASIPGELVLNNAPTRDIDLTNLDQDTSENSKQTEGLVPVGVGDRTNAHLQPEQGLVSNDTNEVQSLTLVNQWNLPKSDAKRLALINDCFRAQSLRSSMDHLNNELERLKNENMVLSKRTQHFNTKFPGLQQELMQLDKVNEELGSIFHLFNEYSETGNALERVLALELELSEALQTKKKSSILFQRRETETHDDSQEYLAIEESSKLNSLLTSLSRRPFVSRKNKLGTGCVLRNVRPLTRLSSCLFKFSKLDTQCSKAKQQYFM